MSYYAATLPSTRGHTVEDQFRLLDEWAKHETGISERLRQSVTDNPRDPSTLARAISMAGHLVPLGEVTGTVYSRRRRAWASEGGYTEMGVVLRSADIPTEPSVYVDMYVLDGGGEVVPELDPRYALVVGKLVASRMEWAGLRELDITSDCTGLVLPTLEPYPTYNTL